MHGLPFQLKYQRHGWRARSGPKHHPDLFPFHGIPPISGTARRLECFERNSF
jgi:hypothetical protein